MVLLRRVIGDALRARRQAQHRTLREVSTAANVSLGYLSEIERGQKEASSELLAAVCEALGAALSEVLRDVSDTLAGNEELPKVLVPVGGGQREDDGSGDSSDGVPVGAPGPAPATSGAPASTPGSGSGASSGSGAAPAADSGPAAAPEARLSSHTRRPSDAKARVTADAKVSIAEGKMLVAVHHDGPLKTTLRATRTTREREPVYSA